jgi:RNA polymerase sigma-70 factor (ECF subfamily)
VGLPATDEQWQRLRADVGQLVARRLPSPADVQDVVQEVMLRVWRSGGALREDERFGPWLNRLARNAVADQMRMRMRHPVPSASPAEPGAATIPPALDDDGEGQKAKRLIAAVLAPFIEALPPRYRECVRLSELEELPHSAIATRLGLSVSGVKSRVQRGRARLREMLELCCRIAIDVRGSPVSCEMRADAVIPPGCSPSQLPDHCRCR